MPTGVASATPCLALDIGGTKAEAAVVTRDGVVVRRERLDVKAAGAQLFEEISEMLERVRADHSYPHSVSRARARCSRAAYRSRPSTFPYGATLRFASNSDWPRGSRYTSTATCAPWPSPKEPSGRHAT